ncbi:hypothetical protein ACVIIW_006858 [Bradyrhizobium sp. USDA 4449]
MNGLLQTMCGLTVTVLPVEFEALAPPPLLLSGEHLDHYQALRQRIFADLAPRSAIEWLLAIDVAELSWEIQRYRMLRHKLLEAYRQQAIEAGLWRRHGRDRARVRSVTGCLATRRNGTMNPRFASVLGRAKGKARRTRRGRDPSG